MSVRAKFKVDSIKHHNCSGKNVSTIELTPVYSADKETENAKFWAYTPNGSINLSTVNPDAASQFEVAKEYYIDFTPADQ